MSPLARSLLALACAALLYASSADDIQDRVRAVNPDPKAYIATLKSGILNDQNSKKNELQPFPVRPTNKTDFSFNVPNSAKAGEALIGQHLWVVGQHKNIALKLASPGKHSPVKVHCNPPCDNGILVLGDQYVIPIIL